MPLRYLQLPETQYIPKHTPISENLLGRTSETIAAQSQAGLQYKLDTLDELNRATRERYGGLSEQDQAYVADELLGVRSRLEEAADTQGTRQMHRHVGREAREFQNKMRYHDRAAAEMSQIREAVESAESPAPSNVIGFIQSQAGKIQYDDETGAASGFQSDLNPYHLRTIENWVDLDEFVRDFSKKAEFGVQGSLEESITSEGFKITDATKAIFGDTVMSTNLSRMMSNPQIREQLYLMGLADKKAFEENLKRMEEAGVENLPENPYVSDSEIKVHFKDEKGNDIVEVLPIEEYIATNIVRPYAQRMQFQDRTFKVGTTGLARSNVESELNAVGLSGIDVAEITNIPKFMQDTYKDKIGLKDQALSIRTSLLENLSSLGVSDMSMSDNNDVQVLINNKWNTWDDFVASLDNPGLVNSAREEINTYRNVKNKARNIEKKLDSIVDGAMEELVNHPDFGQVAHMFDINPKTGNVQMVGGSIAELVDTGQLPKGFKVEQREGFFPELASGEIFQMPRRDIPNIEKMRGAPTLHDDRPVFVYRDGDEYRMFQETSRTVSPISEARDFLQNSLANIANEVMETGRREVAMHYFDEHEDRDKRMINIIQRAAPRQGTLQTSKGEAFELDSDQKFVPISFYNQDGDFFIEGFVEDQEGTREKGVALFGGELATNLLRDQLGDEFYHYTALSTIKSQIPKLWQSDTNNITLNRDLLSNLGLVNLPDISITFDYKINRQNPNNPKRVRHYRIQGEGISPIVVNNQEKIYRELLMLSTSRSR